MSVRSSLRLVRFAPLLCVALFGIPRTATAAELASSGHGTGVTAKLELNATVVFARAEARADVRRLATSSVAPAAPVLLSLHGALIAIAAPDAPASVDASISVRQPPARAPPVPS